LGLSLIAANNVSSELNDYWLDRIGERKPKHLKPSSPAIPAPDSPSVVLTYLA
jgi:hypothetical protein